MRAPSSFHSTYASSERARAPAATSSRSARASGRSAEAARGRKPREPFAALADRDLGHGRRDRRRAWPRAARPRSAPRPPWRPRPPSRLRARPAGALRGRARRAGAARAPSRGRRAPRAPLAALPASPRRRSPAAASWPRRPRGRSSDGSAAGVGSSLSAAQPTPTVPCGSSPERYATAIATSSADAPSRHSVSRATFASRDGVEATSADVCGYLREQHPRHSSARTRSSQDLGAARPRRSPRCRRRLRRRAPVLFPARKT